MPLNLANPNKSYCYCERLGLLYLVHESNKIARVGEMKRLELALIVGLAPVLAAAFALPG